MNPVLRRLLWRLLYPSPASRRLKQYEMRVLERTGEAMPAADRTILQEQVNQIDLVQRSHSNRMVLILFANRDGVPRLADQRPANVLVTLSARSDRRALGQVDVVSHHGLVNSIEFTKSPKDWNDDVRLKVTTRSKAPTLAAEIDSLEHAAPDES